MPRYTYICDNCMKEQKFFMNISEFLANRDKKMECSLCDEGVLFYRPSRILVKVDRDATEVKEQIKEDVVKTVEKVRSGDSKTINDIYGDKANPYKK